MKVAVTGAAGHLGGVVVRKLVEKGASVRALAFNDRRAIEGLPLEIHEGDLRDRAVVDRLFDGCERVLHLAAVISLEPKDEQLMREVNVGGVRNVVDAARAAGVKRVVHVSSIHAFSALPKDATVDETRGPAESDAPPYDRSKAAGEAVVREAVAAGLDVVTVNPTAIVGPFDFRPSRMGEVMLDLYHRRLPGLVAGGFDWVDVRDVSDSVLAAAEHGTRGGRYLLPGQWRTVVELAGLVEQLTGKKAPRMVSPMWLARAAAPFAVGWAKLVQRRPLFTPNSLVALRNHKQISGARARADLGHNPRPLDETVRDAFAWFREKGMLNN
jgi:dihydroflavonol-4-reductase